MSSATSPTPIHGSGFRLKYFLQARASYMTIRMTLQERGRKPGIQFMQSFTACWTQRSLEGKFR